MLITAGETATVVVTFVTWAAGPSVTGSYTFSAPVALQGTLVASFSPNGAMGCGFPATVGCPEYIDVNGTGWSPKTTYNLTITGPGITGAAGNTATTDATGTITSTSADDFSGFSEVATLASTTAPPTPGTYSVTMGGVTASTSYTEGQITVAALVVPPASCTAASSPCPYDVDFLAINLP